MHVTEFLMTHVTNKILNVGDIRSERRSHYGKKIILSSPGRLIDTLEQRLH